MNNHFQSIYWHSGLYLQPQHFQLTDIQQQYWNHRHHQLSTPFYWGMIRFELDLQALRNQELSATHAVLLFPDGALIDCDVNGILPPRSLHQFTLDCVIFSQDRQMFLRGEHCPLTPR